MAKFIYRIFLVLAIVAAIWGGVYYIMDTRSGEHLQSGVELACHRTSELASELASEWTSGLKEMFCRG